MSTPSVANSVPSTNTVNDPRPPDLPNGRDRLPSMIEDFKATHQDETIPEIDPDNKKLPAELRRELTRGVLLPAMDIPEKSLRVFYRYGTYKVEFVSHYLNLMLKDRIVIEEDLGLISNPREEVEYSEEIKTSDKIRCLICQKHRESRTYRREVQSAFETLSLDGSGHATEAPYFLEPITEGYQPFFGVRAQSSEFIVLRKDIKWGDRGRLSLKGDAAKRFLSQLTFKIPSHNSIFGHISTLASNGSCDKPITNGYGEVWLLGTHIKLSRWFWVLKFNRTGDELIKSFGRTADIHDAQAYYERAHNGQYVFLPNQIEAADASLKKVAASGRLTDEERVQHEMNLGVPSIRHGLKDLLKASKEAIKIEKKRFKDGLLHGKACYLAHVFNGPDVSKKVREMIYEEDDLSRCLRGQSPRGSKILWKKTREKVQERIPFIPSSRKRQKRPGGVIPPVLQEKEPEEDQAENFHDRLVLYNPNHQSKPPLGWELVWVSCPVPVWHVEGEEYRICGQITSRQILQRVPSDQETLDPHEKNTLDEAISAFGPTEPLGEIRSPLSSAGSIISKWPTKAFASLYPLSDGLPGPAGTSSDDDTIQLIDSNGYRASITSSVHESSSSQSTNVLEAENEPAKTSFTNGHSIPVFDTRQENAISGAGESHPAEISSTGGKRASMSTIATKLTGWTTKDSETTPISSHRPSLDSLPERSARTQLVRGWLNNLTFAKSASNLNVPDSGNELTLSRNTTHSWVSSCPRFEEVEQESSSSHSVPESKHPRRKSNGRASFGKKSKRGVRFKRIAMKTKEKVYPSAHQKPSSKKRGKCSKLNYNQLNLPDDEYVTDEGESIISTGPPIPTIITHPPNDVIQIHGDGSTRNPTSIDLPTSNLKSIREPEPQNNYSSINEILAETT